MAKEIEPLRNAYCVYAGPNSSVDSIFNFIEESAKAGYAHRWILSGWYLVLESRISINTIPSQPILEDEPGIFGATTTGSLSHEWDTLLKPFTFYGWLYIGLSKLVSLLMRVLLAFLFTKQEGLFDWHEFRNRFADYENRYQRNQDHSEKW